MRALSPRQQQGLLLLLVPALIPALLAGWASWGPSSLEETPVRPLVGLKLGGPATRSGLYLFENPPSPGKVLDLAGAPPGVLGPAPAGFESGVELKLEGGSLKSLPLAEGERYLLGLKLDLNRASLEELTLLPGIGPIRAKRIIDLRQRRGGLSRVEDLLAVEGLGPALVRRLEPLVRTGPRDGFRPSPLEDR